MDIRMEQFHNRLAELMNEIHVICVSNGIEYTMLGGTLIGALRHKGFIPWDDDIDIGMTYDNYKRFIQIVFNSKHDWVDFDLAGVTNDYYCPFIKAYDNRTTFIEGDRDIPRGIFIDIFPIVYAGNTKMGAFLSFKKHRFLQALLKRKAYHFDTGYSRERMLTAFAKCFSVNYLMAVINDQYEMLNKKKVYWSSDMDGNSHGIVPTELFENYVLYDFEKYKFMGIKYADRYLRMVFGDYMKLPPEDKRIPHHIDFLDLNLPYRDFKKNER